MAHSPKRHLILLLLLPQLFLLGLGRSVVLCVSPGGHVEVEFVSSSCCGLQPQPGLLAATGGPGTQATPSSDCGPCDDVAVIADFRGPETLRLPGVDPAITTLPAAERPTAGPGWDPGRASPPPSFRHTPRHLKALRSVVLRC